MLFTPTHHLRRCDGGPRERLDRCCEDVIFIPAGVVRKTGLAAMASDGIAIVFPAAILTGN